MDNQDYSFTRDQRDAEIFTRHLNPLPRSVMRPNDFLLLDGEWCFEPDPDDAGLREEWYLGHEYRRTAIWPSTIEATMAEAGYNARVDGTPDTIVAWYEREFTVPQEWVSSDECLPQITFGACGYETRVWLNGYLLQTIEGEQVHFGEYISFSYELPLERLLPVNRLTVRIADSLDAEVPRGKQESRVYKRGGIWYQTISGPLRSVWLETVSRNRLRSRLGVISSIEDRLVEFILTLRIHDRGLYRLRLMIGERGKTQPVAVSEFELPLEVGDRMQRIVMGMPDALLWSPATPNLHHLTAQLIGPDSNDSIAQIETHFGLRKIEARGRGIYLNNEAIYLDGILYQPATATFEEITRHMHAMKALGCNLVRVHIAGIDPRIYDLADEIGLLLWVEVPSPHSPSQRSRDNHAAELMRLLVMIGSHPSIIICSLYNEDWGAQDIAVNALTREYIAYTFNYMRVHHPQVLVVDNDGWRHVSTEGRLESHLLSAHVYTPDLADWRDRLGRLARGEFEGVTAEAMVVGDPFFYRGQVPLVVSEWGGFGFANYGGPEETSAKVARIREFKAALREQPIAGDVYTQATSIEDEVNGLVDPQTGELQVPPGTLASSG
jgi:beta-galactosidase/beta-glucuronidase